MEKKYGIQKCIIKGEAIGVQMSFWKLYVHINVAHMCTYTHILKKKKNGSI